MRKMLLSLAAVTVMVLGTAQLSRADLILGISINGGAYTTFTCLGTCAGGVSGSLTVGAITVTASGNSNLPGGGSALNSHSSTTAQSGAAGGFADIYLKAIGFTSPVQPPSVYMTVTGSTSAGVGLVDYIAGGGGDAANSGNVVTAAVSCTMTTAPNGCTGTPSTLFPNGPGAFSLTSTGHLDFGANALISGTSTIVASNVPEPASMFLLGSGLLGLGGLVRRKVKR